MRGRISLRRNNIRLATLRVIAVTDLGHRTTMKRTITTIEILGYGVVFIEMKEKLIDEFKILLLAD